MAKWRQRERVRALSIEKGLKMIVDKVQHSGAYVISESVGEGAKEYLFTKTYYNYTLREAKRLFKIAIKEEAN